MSNDSLPSHDRDSASLADQSASVAVFGSGDCAVTREEFATLAVAHRRAQLPKLLGVVPIPAAAFSAQGLLASLPSLSLWLAMSAGVAVAATLFAGLWRREHRRLREWAMACPNCGDWLLPPHARTRDMARTELITASDVCPSCGVTLFGSPPTAM